jgi:hypothetical protein
MLTNERLREIRELHQNSGITFICGTDDEGEVFKRAEIAERCRKTKLVNAVPELLGEIEELRELVAKTTMLQVDNDTVVELYLGSQYIVRRWFPGGWKYLHHNNRFVQKYETTGNNIWFDSIYGALAAFRRWEEEQRGKYYLLR